MLLALLGSGPDQFGNFGHFEPDLLIDDFHERDIGGTVIAGLDERPAHCAGAGIKLAHAARNEVNQNVGIPNFLQCFLRKFGVQGFLS